MNVHTLVVKYAVGKGKDTKKRYKEKNSRAPQKIVLAKERKDAKTTNRNFYI